MANDNEAVSTDLRQFLTGVVPSSIEIVAVRVAGKPPARKVTIIIGKVGGLTLDEVADTASVINQALDEVENTPKDPVPGEYTLEVTTPGVNWPLTTQADFVRVGTHSVTVQPHDGASVTGPVVQATDDAVTIKTDAGPVTVEYRNIRKAVQTLPF
ncbi:hypothetical protein [Stomatohabitans albus]|uniref:ribosome maturation factor RimP n=1 Tax=Stomatohabitans albus TaxID=3110766 RepID=UPI00300D1208